MAGREEVCKDLANRRVKLVGARVLQGRGRRGRVTLAGASRQAGVYKGGASN